MRQAQTTKQTNDILPQDLTQALKVLINFSERLLDLAERETQALVQNDLGTFSILQNEKDVMSRRYADASEEFRGRMNEFRAADPGLLDRLENLQKELGDKLHSNNDITMQLFTRAKEKTTNSLFTLQEASQGHALHMPLSLKTDKTTGEGA